MKNHSLRKRIVCGALALMTAQSMFFLSGCSTAMDDGRDDGIELIDPVNVSVSCVAVERRNFYDMSAIYAICSPQVTESSFTSDINFYGYESMPGKKVKKGDVLAGMRVIPLVIDEEKMNVARSIGKDIPLFSLLPFKQKKYAISLPSLISFSPSITILPDPVPTVPAIPVPGRIGYTISRTSGTGRRRNTHPPAPPIVHRSKGL